MKKLTFIIFPLIAFQILIFCSCSKCGDEQVVTEDRFSDSYQVFMPFTGTDTLRFLKNGKDTVMFLGKGKEIFYNEVERGGGDCAIKYRLLNHKINFTSSNTGENLSVYYYKYSETNAFRDFFEIHFNSVLNIGPNEAVFTLITSSIPRLTISVLGITYNSALPLIAGSDTIYIGFKGTSNSFIRIRQQNNIYELIP
ncbi:MAG: hypothetical protein WCO28_08210 [Bacteroidota bacterium]